MGKLAAKVDKVDYIILIDNNSYLRISASPANSIFIGDFDRMISTLKFTDGQISKEDAVNMVLGLPEVKNYLNRVKNSKVEYSHDSSDGKKLVIHVYELLSDHTATFNWYDVDKVTRQITKEF